MNGILLDTHVWIWYAIGSSELTTKSIETITEALHHHQAYISAISLWEICMLEKKKRITLGMPYLEWMNKPLSLTQLKTSALTPEIISDSCYLPGAFHADPADRLITATARVENLELLTRDELICAFGKQGFVSVLKV